jgi:hypothetical protein
MTEQRSGQGVLRFETLLEELPFSVRTYQALRRSGFLTLSDLTAASPASLRGFSGLGQRSIIELVDVLNNVSVPHEWYEALMLDAATVGGRKVLPERQPVSARYVVYFMGCESFVKIGLSACIEQRHRSIQHATPFTVSVLAVIERDGPSGIATLEAELHERFAAYRHRGEWFRYEGELADYVEGLRANRAA